MPNYAPQITAYNSEINTNITVKTAVNSIDPVDVGEGFTDLANLLLPIINQINEFNVLGGSTAPTSGMGVLNDVYFEFGPSLKIYKKSATDWVLKVNGDLGINIVDGNISVQLTIIGSTVTSSSGNWGIDNTIYGKTLPDEYTVPTADENYDRIDGLFGNKSNAVVYEQGTASSTPTNPATPTDTVSIGYVYVPSQASGNGAYIIGGVPPIIATLQSVLDSGRVGDRMQITQSLEIPIAPPTVVNAGNIWVGAGTSALPVESLELTTTGTSGAATLVGNVLNIPVYTSGGGGSGTVTSVGVTSTDLDVSGSPVTSSGSITLNVKNGAITFAKMQNLGATSLVGNSTGSSATMERITIGSGLSLTGGVLSATGGGGGGGDGTVTSVAAGNGMNFTTITATGTVTLGTPSSITASSSNSVSSGTHTHAIDLDSITSLNLSTRLRIPTSAPGSIASGDIWVGTGTTAANVSRSKVISTATQSGTSFSIGSAQAATYITATNSSSITATISSGVALSSVFVQQGGSGKVTFSGSGVTVNVKSGKVARTEAQNGVVEIFYKTSTEVIITGDLDV